MSQDLRGRLEKARSERPAIGNALVLPGVSDASNLLDRRLASRWWRDVEKVAGIDHIRGRGWHSLRRNWATDRMHKPDKAVAEAGGWKDTATMKLPYQQPDRKMMYDVVCATG